MNIDPKERLLLVTFQKFSTVITRSVRCIFLDMDASMECIRIRAYFQETPTPYESDLIKESTAEIAEELSIPTFQAVASASTAPVHSLVEGGFWVFAHAEDYDSSAVIWAQLSSK